MKRAAAFALLLIALTTVGASANQESERLRTLGLVELHAGRYPKALDLFTQAVQADGNDAYSLYYRGVSEARSANYGAAVADLQAALERKPDLPQAPLELGVALVQNGQNRDAIPWLEKAQGSPDLEAQASLFLGIAQLRLGDFATAQLNFQRAVQRDPGLGVAARYYQGIAAYQRNDWKTAEDHFRYVATSSPASDLGREANIFLDRIRGQGDPAYQVYGEAGLQYDSNLVLAPSSGAVKSTLNVGRVDDGRAVLIAGGVWSPIRRDNLRLTVGYEFFQSLQFHRTDYNLQNHRPNLQLSMAAGPVRFGLYARYDYYLEETQSFLQDFIIMPWAAVLESAWGRTDIFFRTRLRDFYASPYRGVLDGYNFSPGIRQLVYFGAPERYLSLAYRFDRQESEYTNGDVFAYDGNEVALAVGWDLPLEVLGQLGYAYRHQTYDSASLGRRDDANAFSVILERPITPLIDVVAGYYGAIHDSNQPVFEYDRQIGSITVRMKY